MKSKPLLLAALAVIVALAWLINSKNDEADSTKQSADPGTATTKSTEST